MSSFSPKFDLGIRVQDKISGYIGTTCGVYFRRFGNTRYEVSLDPKQGVATAENWFDEEQLEPEGKHEND